MSTLRAQIQREAKLRFWLFVFTVVGAAVLLLALSSVTRFRMYM